MRGTGCVGVESANFFTHRQDVLGESLLRNLNNGEWVCTRYISIKPLHVNSSQPQFPVLFPFHVCVLVPRFRVDDTLMTPA